MPSLDDKYVRKKKTKRTDRGKPETREVEDSPGSWVPSSWQQ